MAINTWPYKAWATGSPYTHSQTHSTMPSPKKVFLKWETFISQLLKNKKWHSNISSPQTTDDAFECYNWNQQQFAHLTHKHYRFTMLYSHQIDNQSFVCVFLEVTWMNWMVMADFPTPPPPTTTILYVWATLLRSPGLDIFALNFFYFFGSNNLLFPTWWKSVKLNRVKTHSNWRKVRQSLWQQQTIKTRRQTKQNRKTKFVSYRSHTISLSLSVSHWYTHANTLGTERCLGFFFAL